MAKPGKNSLTLEACRAGHYDAGAEYARNAIGKRIAEERRRRGLSQGEFASLLRDFGIRIGLRGYAKWETGETVPNAYQLLAIFHALRPPEGASWLSGGESALNAEGLRRLDQYREDLVASGRYKPAARMTDNAVEYREALLSRLRTQRTTGMNVLRSYQACRRLGLSEPTDKAVFEKVQQMTFADVLATQRKWVKDRTYTHAILGDIADMDMQYLKSLGTVKVVSLEEIFGY